MAVVPELSNEQQDLLNKLLGQSKAVKENFWHRWQFDRRKVFLALVIVVILLVVGIYIRENKPQPIVSISQNIQQTIENVSDSQVATDGIFDQTNGGVYREQTGQFLELGIHSQIIGSTQAVGFVGARGQIYGGKASSNLESLGINLANNVGGDQSRFELQAWDVNEKALSNSPTWTNDEASSFTNSGDFVSVIYLPIGTNSVVLKERNSNGILDRIYVDNTLPQVVIYPLKNEYKKNEVIEVNGSLVGKSEGVSLALRLQNKNFVNQKVSFPVVNHNENLFSHQISLQNVEIVSDGNWNVEVSVATAFRVTSVGSNQFIIRK